MGDLKSPLYFVEEKYGRGGGRLAMGSLLASLTPLPQGANGRGRMASNCFAGTLTSLVGMPLGRLLSCHKLVPPKTSVKGMAAWYNIVLY